MFSDYPNDSSEYLENWNREKNSVNAYIKVYSIHTLHTSLVKEKKNVTRFSFQLAVSYRDSFSRVIGPINGDGSKVDSFQKKRSIRSCVTIAINYVLVMIHSTLSPLLVHLFAG